MPDTSLMIAGAVSCVAGAGFWWMEIAEERKHRSKLATYARGRGVVSRIAIRGWLSKNEPTELAIEDDEKVKKVPVVRFRASDGAEYEFDAPDAPHTIGAEVDVAYDPAIPSSAQMTTRQKKPGCAIILFVIGIALIAYGALKP
jgi:hypothetical protein